MGVVARRPVHPSEPVTDVQDVVEAASALAHALVAPSAATINDRRHTDGAFGDWTTSPELRNRSNCAPRRRLSLSTVVLHARRQSFALTCHQ